MSASNIVTIVCTNQEGDRIQLDFDGTCDIFGTTYYLKSVLNFLGYHPESIERIFNAET